MIAKPITANHIGITVLFLYPTPKLRNDPSRLYKNDGLCVIIKTYTKTNKIIAKETIFLLTKFLFKSIYIYIILSKKNNILLTK